MIFCFSCKQKNAIIVDTKVNDTIATNQIEAKSEIKEVKKKDTIIGERILKGTDLIKSIKLFKDSLKTHSIGTILHYQSTSYCAGGFHYVFWSSQNKKYLNIYHNKNNKMVSSIIALENSKVVDFVNEHYVFLKNNKLMFPKTKKAKKEKATTFKTDSGFVYMYELPIEAGIGITTHQSYQELEIYNNGKTIATDRIYEEHFEEFLFDYRTQKNIHYSSNIKNNWFTLIQIADKEIQNIEDSLFKGIEINNSITLK